MNRQRRKVKMILPIAVVLGGTGVMVWLVQSRPAPDSRSEPRPTPVVVVETIAARAAAIPVVGYGTVRAKNQVQIVPEVTGKLVYSHPSLAEGEVIGRGELLFELDSSVYAARVQQAEAEVQALEATCARHDQEMSNLDSRIEIGEKLLVIDERDLETSRRLLEHDSIGTQQSLDATQQKYLQRQDLVMQLRNQRAVMPHVKREALAGLSGARARLAQAKYDLENTKIYCPFSAQVESVKAHKAQIVTAHIAIATLTDMETLELPVSIDPRELRWLDQGIRPLAHGLQSAQSSLNVKITWTASDQDVFWYGHVSRFERIDEMTRTARMIVEIPGSALATADGDRSYDNLPTISIGMHCRAELPAAELSEAVLIPWHAIQENRWVYVFEPTWDGPNQSTGKLGRREVGVLRTIEDMVLVGYRGYKDAKDEHLKVGDQLVLSHLANPIVGMSVALQNRSDYVPERWDNSSAIPKSDLVEANQSQSRLVLSNSQGQ